MKQVQVSISGGMTWYVDLPFSHPPVIQVQLVDQETGKALSTVWALVKVEGAQVKVVSWI